ncbi:MAG TPA: DUF5668 domain-containing protein [Candidatus Angelobacter sp.]|nr:DUF5668 domain-containing protein [Candidatus Angelobacter sp.]
MRCRAHGMMGAAVLITLGVLFLLENYSDVPFDKSFPVLLLVIGAVLLVSRSGSTEGHIDPQAYGNVIAPPVTAPQPQQQWTTGTPAPPAPTHEPNEPQVKP